MALPARVTMFEAGPRDGLQNEKSTVTTAQKIELIDRLADCGLTKIEAGSFVSPKWVPQMADTAEVYAGLQRRAGVSYAALTPNMRGLEGALAAGASEIGVFAAATESFSKANTNCSIAESIERFSPVAEEARRQGMPMRGAVSVVLGCPFEGDVPAEQVAAVVKDLHDLGCYEIALGDSIGTGTPKKTQALIEACAARVPLDALAVHFHDTYGQALANILASVEAGVATIDSSVAGLGGCPYAPGATGNVATEDVVYMLNGMDIETGVDLAKLVDTAWFICDIIGRRPVSRVANAIRGKQQRAA